MSDSLSDLNVYSDNGIVFTDDRPFSVVISGATNETYAINANEGDSLTLKLVQAPIEIISGSSTADENVKIEVDLSNALAPQFSWGALPSGVTSSEPSTDVFKVTGIENTVDFNTLMTNAVFEIVDQEAAFTYTVKVYYEDDGSPVWTTTNTVTIVTTYSELSVPATMWYSSVQTNVSDWLLTNEATVIDNETTTAATYTITATFDVSEVTDISSTGGGSATTTVDGSDRIRTITGTLAQVNAHLNTLVLDIGAVVATATCDYRLTNNLSGVVTTGSSTGEITGVIPWTSETVVRAYTENTVTTNVFATNPPQLDASELSTAFGDATYKVRIQTSGGQSDVGIYSSPNSDFNNVGWMRDSGVASKEGHQWLDKTDTPANINTWLANNIEHIPIPSTSVVQYLKLKLWRTSGAEIVPPVTIQVDGTADASAVPGAGTTTYLQASSPYSTIAITDAMRFFLKSDVLVVGSGGTGGVGDDGVGGGDKGAGGGGGAGQYYYYENSSLLTGGRFGYDDFDVIVPEAQTGYHDSANFAQIKGDGSTNIIKANSGGYGGYSQTTEGENGGNGGFGGGGGWDDTFSTNGTKGFGVNGTETVTYFKDGSETSSGGDPAGNGEDAVSERGGNGGGTTSGYSNDISGSTLTYSWKGLGGVSGGNNTVSGAYGSGGSGAYGAGDSGGEYVRSHGQDGVVIIKLYEF